MKDQVVKIRAQDMRHAKAIKRELAGVPLTEIAGASLFGWRFLTAEQKMAALQRSTKLLTEPATTAA